jgi:hypothetical protein
VIEQNDQREELTSISEDDAADLVSTREGAAYLLDLLSRTARPGRGAAPLLRALGQLARSAPDALFLGREHWFDGGLIVEVVAVGSGITIDVSAGKVSLQDRLFERMYFSVPFDELRWMVERVPELAGALRMHATPSRFTSLILIAPGTPSRLPKSGYAGHVAQSSADDTSKIVVSPESLIDPDSTSPVPALMAELAVLSRASQLDPREL